MTSLRKRPPPALAAVVAAVLIGAGCGDDDESTTTTGGSGSAGTISKAQWIKRADAICAKGDRELQKAQAELRASGAPSQGAIEKLATDAVIPTVRKEAAQIRALPTP